MNTTVRTSPPNAVILIEDSLGGDIPTSMNLGLVVATNSCIAVGCRADIDGETEIAFTGFDDSQQGDVVFEGRLQVKSRELVIRTVLGETLLKVPVEEDSLRLRIRANEPREPDRLSISLIR